MTTEPTLATALKLAFGQLDTQLASATSDDERKRLRKVRADLEAFPQKQDNNQKPPSHDRLLAHIHISRIADTYEHDTALVVSEVTRDLASHLAASWLHLAHQYDLAPPATALYQLAFDTVVGEHQP